MFRASALSAVALLLVGCGDTGPVSPDEVQLSTGQLTAERGEQDAIAAVARGDFSLVGVRGFVLEVPGVENISGAMANDQYGVRQVADTGDMLGGRVTSTRNENALAYARAYNKVVMDRRGN